MTFRDSCLLFLAIMYSVRCAILALVSKTLVISPLACVSTDNSTASWQPISWLLNCQSVAQPGFYFGEGTQWRNI